MLFVQRCRSVLKYGGSGSVRSSHQTVSDYALRQWFPNTQQSRFLTACRRLEKLVLPSVFDARLSSLMIWNLQSYPTTVLNERMWHFRGLKHTLTPSYIFSEVKTPNPRILRPCSTASVGLGLYSSCLSAVFCNSFFIKYYSSNFERMTLISSQYDGLIAANYVYINYYIDITGRWKCRIWNCKTWNCRTMRNANIHTYIKLY